MTSLAENHEKISYLGKYLQDWEEGKKTRKKSLITRIRIKLFDKAGTDMSSW